MNADSQWIEIKNDKGQVYYFNKITGISTQEKPLALRMTEQKDSSVASFPTNKQAATSNVSLGEALTGNGAAIGQRSIVSNQKKQEELTELFAERNLNIPKNIVEQNTYQQQYGQNYQAGDSARTYVPGADPNMYMNQVLNQTLKNEQRDIYPTLNYFRTEEKQSDTKRFKSYDNLSKEDAEYVFKEALRDAGVSTSWKWEDANRVVMHDPRVKAIKAISERKIAFSNYINEMKTKERNDTRQRRQQQREGFQELLKEQKQLHSLSKYYQVAKTLQSDPRFKNVEEKDREEIFQDYLDDLMNKEREEKREQYEKKVEQLKSYFQERNVSINSKWNEIEKSFKEDSIFSSVEPLEQITAYEEYMKALDRADFQQKKLEKRRSERKNRENFGKLLEEKITTREITHRTKWKDFVRKFKDDNRYYNLVGQPGSNPHELFEDCIKEEKDILKIHKPSFKTLIKSNGIRFPNNVQFEAFDSHLNQYEEYSQLSKRTKILLHEYYLYKVKQKEQERAKKLAKLVRNYEKYLKSLININKTTDYADYKFQIDKQSEFNPISDEQKLKSFTDLVQHLKEDQSKKQKKRSRSRARSSRSSSVESGEVKSSKKKKKGGSSSSNRSDAVSNDRKHRSSSKSEQKKKKHY